MTTLTSTTGVGGLLAEAYGPLIVQSVTDAAIATQVTNVVTTGSHEFHVPTVVKDAGAAWVAEGAEIPADDAAFAEVVVVPAKLAGLTTIRSELAEESSPGRRRGRRPVPGPRHGQEARRRVLRQVVLLLPQAFQTPARCCQLGVGVVCPCGIVDEFRVLQFDL